MARRTKKVGTSGRYKARYGVRARTRIRDVERQQRMKHVCPQCGNQSIQRISTGIWQCKKCNHTFAGGAYIPRTEAAQNVDKFMRGETETLEVE